MSAPLKDALAAVRLPVADTDEEVIAVAVMGPVDRPAAVTDPAVEKLFAVTEPDVRSDEPVISAAVRLPVVDRDAASKLPLTTAEAAVTAPLTATPDVPIDAPVAVIVPAVTAPELETDEERSRPVTLTALAARLPATVVVREASEPMVTESAFRPMRTTPVAEPAPPSRMRSPPTDAPSPDAWPMTYVLRPRVAVARVVRPIVTNESPPNSKDPTTVAEPAEEIPAAETAPAVVRLATLTAAAVRAPVVRLPEVTGPLELTNAAVKPPDVRSAAALMSAAVNAPDTDTPAAEREPPDDREADVKLPLVEMPVAPTKAPTADTYPVAVT